MKLGPKQQERIEGWLGDTLRQYNYIPKKFTVSGNGIRYDAEAEFTQRNNKYYTEYHDTFFRSLKESVIKNGKITTTAEIAKLWQNSKYYEQANQGITIDLKNLKYKAETLLSRKPHKDVINFLQNIRGKVTINFDSYYETLLNELNEYYNSYEYEDALEELKYNATANQYIINISYYLDLDDFDFYGYNYTQRYQSVDEFINENKNELLYSMVRDFPDIVPAYIKSVFNHSLKSLQNLNNPDKPITVTKVTLKFDTLSHVAFDIQLSDHVSFNQIEQLMAEVKPEINSISLSAECYNDWINDDETIDFNYYYSTYTC